MKIHVIRKGFTLILMGLLVTALFVPVFAEDTVTQITIRVDGLSCPFCAYGLEKKLKRLEGTENVRIDIDQGIAEITVEEGKTILEENLKKAVLDAGFKPRKITYGSVKP